MSLARPDYFLGYYPKKGIIITEYVMSGIFKSYYKISTSGNASKIGSEEHYSFRGDYWAWGNKEVTQTEFNTLLEKAAGKNLVTIQESDWHENTVANRRNMEKLIKNSES